MLPKYEQVEGISTKKLWFEKQGRLDVMVNNAGIEEKNKQRSRSFL